MARKQNCVVSFLNIIDSIEPNENGCMNWSMGLSRTGYGVYSIGNFTYSVPRLLFNTLRSGLYDDKMVVRHKCDNRACCNIEHLEIGTQSENLMDASKRGRLRLGIANNKTFLSEEDVRKIRSLYPSKSTVDLAKEYKTTPFCIQCVITGKTWGHVDGAKPLIRLNRALGEKMGRSKLKREQILEIRSRYPKETKAKLARDFGVGHAMICRIVNRKNWRHI